MKFCSVCGDKVLVSKAGWTSGDGPRTVDPETGLVGVSWIAHNGCISRMRARRQWDRVVGACGGDEEQAKRILEVV